MKFQEFASVWDAIGVSDEEAGHLKLRSALMMALRDRLTRTQVSQAQAAALLNVSQPRISDLMNGKINLFSLDTLVNMANVAGLRVHLTVTEAAHELPLEKERKVRKSAAAQRKVRGTSAALGA
jgi:predicted XRE-type DNA-binding protein